jgi:hypothetical protein
MRGAEDYPDMTAPELRDADEDDEFSMSDEEFEEMEEEFEDMREGALLLLQAAALGQMFYRGEITLRDYIEMVEVIEDIADEKGVDMP